jgi:hypothetical protein
MMNKTLLATAFSLFGLVVGLGCGSEPQGTDPDMNAADADVSDMNATDVDAADMGIADADVEDMGIADAGNCEGAGPPIEPETLYNGVVSVAYELDLEVFGGSQEGVTWSIAEGALPTGLALDVMTGSISGTPTMAGESTFAVSADIPPSDGCVIEPAYRDFTMTVTERDTAGDWSCTQSRRPDVIFACSDYPDADEAAASAHCDFVMGSGGDVTVTFTEEPCSAEDQFARCRYDYMGTTVVWIFYGEGVHDLHESSCGSLDGVYERL